MKHQIMFSLICLSTLFLNNVFAATTCPDTTFDSDEYTVANRFNWNNLCSEETDNKITLYTAPHSDSDDYCEDEISLRDTLSVCVDNTCGTYYNEQYTDGIKNHGWFFAPNYNNTDSLCYAAYFYHNEMTSPILTNHPVYKNKKLGVGTLSKYDNIYTYKYTGKLSKTEIYNLTDSYDYDIETLFDNKFDLPGRGTTNFGTYNTVYKTKKIALIFSEFMAGSSTNSIKAQCKKDTTKCYMVICDFGDLDDCVAPTITAVGVEEKHEANGVTYKTKEGKTYFATKFVTSPETEKNTEKRYEITAGEPIPLETLKEIMNDIVDIYDEKNITLYR
ncbi:MAG: hypothetical protein IKW67_02500, partial [Alphaproteobacteria bacterium]|nr:hypothetical protein [Alphaproteobacteria bacterium]